MKRGIQLGKSVAAAMLSLPPWGRLRQPRLVFTTGAWWGFSGYDVGADFWLYKVMAVYNEKLYTYIGETALEPGLENLR